MTQSAHLASEQTFWIGGQRVSRAEMDTTNVARVQQLLKYDYDRGVRPRCLCKNPGVEMVVRKLFNRYVIARMPETGMSHVITCDSYSAKSNPLHGDMNRTASMQRDKEGILKIRLNVPLTERREKLTNKPVSHIERTQSSKNGPQTTLLGIIYSAWDEESLNRWHPNMEGRRGWWTIHRSLTEYSTSVMIGRRPLQDILYVPPTFNRADRQRQLDEFRDFMVQFVSLDDGETQSYAIIVGEVTSVSPTRFGGRLAIKHLKDFPFWISTEGYEQLAKRFERPVRCVNDPEHHDHVVGIFLVRPSNDNTSYHIRTGALMMTNKQWIPVESSYERQIADALIREKRHFTKPVRYDATDDVVFPDFLLLDAASVPVPMEIYGISGNADYESRKREKMTYYEAQHRLYWQWDVGESSYWPAFPRPA